MKAKDGDRVKVHYTGRLQDGSIFDSSREREPLQVTLGSGRVIEGFEKALIGMEPGETKTFTVTPEEGYGPKRPELVVEVRKEDFPEHITPELGQRLQLMRPDGAMIEVVITDMNEELVTLDANHPLAGETLTFEVEMVEIL